MSDRIIITGNIGSGKSKVTEIFSDNGYMVISADEISAKILKRYQQEISKMFSIRPMMFDSFKTELGQMVFTDDTVKYALEDFMLPKINGEIDFTTELFDIQNTKYVVEMPTFFETRGLRNHEGVIIINVVADKAVRIKRIMNRNKHLSIQDVLDRMGAQLAPDLKRRWSFVTIDNSGNVKTLERKVENFIKLMNS